jgi:hypothetical protein
VKFGGCGVDAHQVICVADPDLLETFGISSLDIV